MKITFQLWGQLKQAAGSGKIELDIDDNSTIEQAIQKLADTQGDKIKVLLMKDEQISPTMLFFIKDEQIDIGTNKVLTEDTEISIMSPIAGGQSND